MEVLMIVLKSYFKLSVHTKELSEIAASSALWFCLYISLILLKESIKGSSRITMIGLFDLVWWRREPRDGLVLAKAAPMLTEIQLDSKCITQSGLKQHEQAGSSQIWSEEVSRATKLAQCSAFNSALIESHSWFFQPRHDSNNFPLFPVMALILTTNLFPTRFYSFYLTSHEPLQARVDLSQNSWIAVFRTQMELRK